jgi:transcriptional regulator with XRE-family HTH domain
MTGAVAEARGIREARRLRKVQDLFHLTQTELAEALGTSPSTLARRPLNSRELDTLGVLESIGALACDVVPRTQVALWFSRPKVALDGTSPKQLLATESGRRMVELFLHRAIDNTVL